MIFEPGAALARCSRRAPEPGLRTRRFLGYELAGELRTTIVVRRQRRVTDLNIPEVLFRSAQ
jgi:hypothetical protein